MGGVKSGVGGQRAENYRGKHQCRTASCWRQAQDLDKGAGKDNSSDAEGDQL